MNKNGEQGPVYAGESEPGLIDFSFTASQFCAENRNGSALCSTLFALGRNIRMA